MTLSAAACSSDGCLWYGDGDLEPRGDRLLLGSSIIPQCNLVEPKSDSQLSLKGILGNQILFDDSGGRLIDNDRDH